VGRAGARSLCARCEETPRRRLQEPVRLGFVVFNTPQEGWTILPSLLSLYVCVEGGGVTWFIVALFAAESCLWLLWHRVCKQNPAAGEGETAGFSCQNKVVILLLHKHLLRCTQVVLPLCYWPFMSECSLSVGEETLKGNDIFSRGLISVCPRTL